MFEQTAADSLGARRLGAIAFEASRKYGVQSTLVGGDEIVAARNEFWRGAGSRSATGPR